MLILILIDVQYSRKAVFSFEKGLNYQNHSSSFCTLFLNLYRFNDQMYFIMIRISRSSHREVFYKKCVLRNFAKFTGKHLCQGLFFHKVADHRPVTLLKRRFRHRCFPVNFAKFLRTFFLTEHLRSLLLNISTWFQ